VNHFDSVFEVFLGIHHALKRQRKNERDDGIFSTINPLLI
jgi:hypothetical protein